MSNITDAEQGLRGVRSVQISKGRTGGAGGRFIPGTMTVVTNNLDADFDQANSGSVYGSSNLVKNKRIRALVSSNGFAGSLALFDGFIEDIRPSGDRAVGTATIVARDLLGLLAGYDVSGLARPMELTGQRVTAILDAVGVPAGLRGGIDNGNVLMPAATLESDALSLLQECQRAEYGSLYAEVGQLWFRDRYRPLSVADWSTRQHSFTAMGAGSSSRIPYAPISRTLGGFQDVTRVAATRNGGTKTVTYDDTATNYPPETAQSGPFGLQAAWDADVDVAAQAWHDGWRFDGERIGSLTVRAYPGHDNAITAIAAGYYNPMTRVEIQSTPAGFPSDFNFEARIEEVAHTVTSNLWDVALRVSPYFTRWQDNGASLWYEYGTILSGSDLGGL